MIRIIFSIALMASLPWASLHASALVAHGDEPSVTIVVFRHHPGIIDTKKRMEARNADEKEILKAASTIAHTYGGGLGRGYELSLSSSDLVKWKKAIDVLHAKRVLIYYDHWGLDQNGYGLVPVR